MFKPSVDPADRTPGDSMPPNQSIPLPAVESDPRDVDTANHRPPTFQVIDLDRFPFLSPPDSPDELGWFAHYRVLKLIGEGGMGMVFLAEDPRLKRQVALKVMRPEMAEGGTTRQRFLREARATASLHTHRHDSRNRTG